MVAKAGEGLGFEVEFHGGVRLSELSRKRFGSGPVPLGFGLRILLDTLSGLAALHGSLAFAHGEVAPRNIIVGRDGTARLIPVVAAHWQEDVSPDSEAAGYAAPERLRGDPIDHRADIFSAGVMLWEMITGRSFRGLPAETIAAWVVDGKVPDPVHPDDAPWVVELASAATRALAVDPGARWPHVGVMGAEIENIAEGHMASSYDVAELITGPGETRGRRVSSHAPPAPSFAPTSVSIAPAAAIPRAPLAPSAHPTAFGPNPVLHAPPSAPPLLRERPPPSRPAPKRTRRQSLIAWTTLSAALVLLGVAAHELFDASRGSRPAPAAGQNFVVPLPAPSAAGAAVPAPVPEIAKPSPNAPTVLVSPMLASPSATSLPPPPSVALVLPVASAQPPPSRQPVVPAATPAPVRRTAPAPASNKSRIMRENPFGI
jgi:serine/threonine-protein kinase